jgi:hypothetical protein
MENANKFHHIFEKAEQRLAPLVESLGSRQAVFDAVGRAAVEHLSRTAQTGVFRIDVIINGNVVRVGGTIIDNIVRIGTFGYLGGM